MQTSKSEFAVANLTHESATMRMMMMVMLFEMVKKHVQYYSGVARICPNMVERVPFFLSAFWTWCRGNHLLELCECAKAFRRSTSYHCLHKGFLYAVLTKKNHEIEALDRKAFFNSSFSIPCSLGHDIQLPHP